MKRDIKKLRQKVGIKNTIHEPGYLHNTHTHTKRHSQTPLHIQHLITNSSIILNVILTPTGPQL